jgi:hypothetical protein
MIGSTFPRVRHLPGSNASAEDLHWDEEQAQRFFRRPVVVVEKVDGIHVTFARGPRGRVAFGLKHEWRAALGGQVARSVHAFARQRERELLTLVGDGGHFHAEWLLHSVSMSYRAVPDAVIGTALLDPRGRFIERLAADARIRAAGFSIARPLFVGVLGDRRRLLSLVGASAFGARRMEGIVLCLRDDPHPDSRWAKWVGPWYRHPRAGALSGEHNVIVG